MSAQTNIFFQLFLSPYATLIGKWQLLYSMVSAALSNETNEGSILAP